jgi:hypothetical protein
VGVDGFYVRHILSLACLAPGIVEAIVAGEEPSGLSLDRLMGEMPMAWAQQRARFEFAAR